MDEGGFISLICGMRWPFADAGRARPARPVAVPGRRCLPPARATVRASVGRGGRAWVGV